MHFSLYFLGWGVVIKVYSRTFKASKLVEGKALTSWQRERRGRYPAVEGSSDILIDRNLPFSSGRMFFSRQGGREANIRNKQVLASSGFQKVYHHTCQRIFFYN